jgi:hypothetical protein
MMGGRLQRFLPRAGLAALALALLCAFWIDAYNVGQSGAIDLRNRITGARVLAGGIDPYTYKWSRDDPTIYCDVYNNPHMTVSKTTSSPALLALSWPWASLPYRSGMDLWFVTQWALLLGAGRLWWRAGRQGGWSRGALGIIWAIFVLGDGWHLHAERGQSYVALTFLLALWLAGTLRAGRGWSFGAGFAAGLLAVSRPPYLLLLPVLAWRRRDQIPGMAAAIAVGVLLPMLGVGGAWLDYAHGMEQHGYYYLNAIEPRPGDQRYPPEIEGLPLDSLASYVPIAYADGSVHVVLRALGWEPVSGLGVFLLGAVAFAGWSAWALRRRLDLPRLLLGLAAWAYLLDFFLPAYRNTYNDVLALDFLALGVLVAPRFWAPQVFAALGLAAGFYVYAWEPEVNWQIDLPAMLFAASAVLYLFAPRGDGPMLDTITAPRQNGSC